MTIDEAIKHAEEVAEDEERRAGWFYDKESVYKKKSSKCAEEHHQLAEWLCQLKQIKDIVQEYHDNYIEWGTGQSSVAFHKIVKIIDGGE